MLTSTRNIDVFVGGGGGKKNRNERLSERERENKTDHQIIDEKWGREIWTKLLTLKEEGKNACQCRKKN